jgi:co-chaperonin GroES (HSP10)
MNVVRGKITPLKDKILVSDMNFDAQYTAGGIYIPSDDGKSEGVKPRWGRVWAIGKEQKDVRVGEWIFVEHGRWTRGITVEDEDGKEVIVRMVDNNCILLSADEKPSNPEFGQFTTPEHGSTHRPEDFIQPR